MCVKDPTMGKWIDCHRRTSRARVPAPPEVVVYATHASGMDTDQVQSVYERTYSQVEGDGKVTKDLARQWSQWCNEKAQESLSLNGAEGGELSASFQQLRSTPPDSSRTVKAVLGMGEAMERAQAAMERQSGSAAALRGVPHSEVRERIDAYRKQYLSMPASDRPSPPAAWVKGFTEKDRMSRSAPHDPATLFAVYRTQADPNAFDDREVTYASIDLETAGPPGKDAFDPAHGCIIEVGVVTYDGSGSEVDRYSSLVRPSADAETTYRTGAVAVHGIEWEDVQDAPTWSSVAPEVSGRLRGAVLMAQHDQFERAWLDDHLGRENQHFAAGDPGVDTMRIAQQHLDLPNHRLETISGEMGVPYMQGHRAEHDAEAAGRSFFAMRERIFTTWSEDPQRASLPQPPRGDDSERTGASWAAAVRRSDHDPNTKGA